MSWAYLLMMLLALALGFARWLGYGVGPCDVNEGPVPLFMAVIVLAVVKPL
jgi:hypothetical protein